MTVAGAYCSSAEAAEAAVMEYDEQVNLEPLDEPLEWGSGGESQGGEM